MHQNQQRRACAGQNGPGHAIVMQKGPSAAAMIDLTTPEIGSPPPRTSSMRGKRSGRVEAQLPPPPQPLYPRLSPRGLWWSRPRSLTAAIHSLWMRCWTLSRGRLDTKAALFACQYLPGILEVSQHLCAGWYMIACCPKQACSSTVGVQVLSGA